MNERNDEMILKLKQPYTWEGTEYNEIDLTGLEDLTGEDVCRASKTLTSMGVMATVAEMDPTYCALIAVAATGKPYEFFLRMPAKLFKKVTRRVSRFLLDSDSEESED